MMDLENTLLGLLAAGTVSLLIAVYWIVLGDFRIRPEVAFVWIGVGATFMIGAVAAAIYEAGRKR
ncbi:hypothetical protein [Nonomuraea rosea]|uniref:hypothetical protein n=1 Tax=Nonomuraea rosea TaxID=638574 RepID=UPI0031EBB021